MKAAQEYLASPDRTKDRKASERFAGQVRAWARTIKEKSARELWAAQMLKAFDGKEQLELKGKSLVDPVVAELRKVAGMPKGPKQG